MKQTNITLRLILTLAAIAGGLALPATASGATPVAAPNQDAALNDAWNRATPQQTQQADHAKLNNIWEAAGEAVRTRQAEQQRERTVKQAALWQQFLAERDWAKHLSCMARRPIETI